MSENRTRKQAEIAPWPSVAVDDRDGTEITFGRFQIGRGAGIVVIYRGDTPFAVLAERDMDRVRKWLNRTLDAGVAEMEAHAEMEAQKEYHE